MGTDWSIDDDAPDRPDRYKWHLPNNDLEHVTETVAPSELMIDPEELDIIVTSAPTKSGIQHGWLDWTDESAPDSTWYIMGSTGIVLNRDE